MYLFGCEAVNASGEAVRGLVKFTRGFAAHEFLAGMEYGAAPARLALSRILPATQAMGGIGWSIVAI